ncbi:MAG TPA: hypothetical protein VK866_13075 [Acidimicrobiales bacterium]|nr:hypothetical protein [Acidimicrobiales bacterium]
MSTTSTPLIVALVVAIVAAVAVVAARRFRPRDRLAPFSAAEAAEVRAALERIEAEHIREATAAADRELSRLARAGVALTAIRVTDASGSFAAATVSFEDGTVIVLHEPRTLPLVTVAAALRGGQTVRLRGHDHGDPPRIEFSVNGRQVAVPSRRILRLPTAESP